MFLESGKPWKIMPRRKSRFAVGMAPFFNTKEWFVIFWKGPF
jgi:hypothetical protein